METQAPPGIDPMKTEAKNDSTSAAAAASSDTPDSGSGAPNPSSTSMDSSGVAGSAADDPAHNLPMGRRIYVKSGDTAQFISRKITNANRPDAIHGFPVCLMAKNAAATNVAVKGTAVAASALVQEGAHVVAVPCFRANRSEVSVFVLKAEDVLDVLEASAVANFNVKSSSEPRTTAGAIANAAREGKCCVLQAIGADAVFNAVRSIAVAREYLAEHNDNLDLFMRCEFVHVQLEGRSGDTTAVKLSVLLKEGRLPL